MLTKNLAQIAPIGRISAPTLLLWGLFTVVFILYYVRRLREVGPLSLDTYFVIRFVYVPIVFMLPFAFSDFNQRFAGISLSRTRLTLEPAFHLGVVGIGAFALGAWLTRYIRVPVCGFDFTERSLREFWVTRRGVVVGVVLSLLLIVVMLLLGFEFGKGRQTSLLEGRLRPLFNFWHILHPFVILNVLVYAFFKRSFGAYILGGVLAAVGIFGGTRSASVEPVAIFLAMLCFFYAKRIKLRVAAPVLLVVVLVAVYVAGIREGAYGVNRVVGSVGETLYGGHFSELRDTALVMSGWDGKLLLGRTHVAALMSFVPSYISEFRNKNKLARFTLKSAGFGEVKTHAGLRPILFGEFYFNYGLIGVVIAGIVAGLLVFRLAEIVQDRATGSSHREDMTVCLAAMTYVNLLLCILITGGFFAFYITVFFIGAGGLVAKGRAPASRKPS